MGVAWVSTAIRWAQGRQGGGEVRFEARTCPSPSSASESSIKGGTHLPRRTSQSAPVSLASGFRGRRVGRAGTLEQPPTDGSAVAPGAGVGVGIAADAPSCASGQSGQLGPHGFPFRLHLEHLRAAGRPRVLTVAGTSAGASAGASPAHPSGPIWLVACV